jgi:hypothetical protein
MNCIEIIVWIHDNYNHNDNHNHNHNKSTIKKWMSDLRA